jgi:uncharacterized protein
MNDKSNFKVTVSDDEYTAHVSVAQDPLVKLSLTDLGPLLKDHGVVSGIKKEVLITVIDRYKRGETIENFLVAEGVRPFPGVKPEVEYKFNISSTPMEVEAGKIDYREFSKFISVVKGQLLAVKKKFKKPIDGMTVTGKPVQFQKFDDIQMLVGDSIIKEENEDSIFYKAGLDGVLTFTNNRLGVFPKLDIQEDVDFKVGNIHFKGNVKIGRDVLPDFIIEASGQISIGGSAIACKLKASGSIEVKEGIVGRNKGEVCSDENITASFVENSKLAAKSDIIIKHSIIGSNVKCGGTLKMEMPRSHIIGSTIQASKGLVLYTVGSRFDSSTSLITGIWPENEKHYLEVKGALDNKLNEAKDLETRYGRAILEKTIAPPTFAPKVREDIIRWEMLKNEIQVLFDKMKKAEEDMYDNNAVIMVMDKIYPRVALSIGKGKYVTSQEYNNVTFRYSEEEDKILV